MSLGKVFLTKKHVLLCFMGHLNHQGQLLSITNRQNSSKSQEKGTKKGPSKSDRKSSLSKKDEGLITVDNTRAKDKTAYNLLNQVSWKLHPDNDKASRKLRWMTREKIQDRLKNIKVSRDGRKSVQLNMVKPSQNDSSASSWITADRYSSLSRTRIGQKSVQVERFQNNWRELDKEKIARYVEVLRSNQDRLGMLDNVKEVDPKSDEGPGYKTAVDWWDEWDEEKMQQETPLELKNHYHEMLDWSRDGKLPSFPIDNEVGMEEEQDIPFHKHVFLHDLIEDRFPKHGPIRKFMEVVAIGLSKNPYLTVKEKEDHINWFRDYFNEKREALKTMGAIPDDKAVESGK